MVLTLILLGFCCLIHTFQYEIMVATNCGSYDRTMINSKYVNYTGDSFFEGIASIAQNKQKVPESINNLADRQLVKTHRTTQQKHTQFSYMPVIEATGHHVAIFGFVQTEYRAKKQRIFNIKLGQEVIHTVDIYAEIGYGKFLHKWVEFTIRDDIIYLNGTLPVLNGYNYKTHQVRFSFESVKGKPKIQTLVVVRGSDATPYLYRFLQYEQEKNVVKRDYITDKYRRIPKTPYRYLNADDILIDPPSELERFLSKFINLRSLGCILCALFAVHGEELVDKLEKGMKKKEDQKASKNKKE